MWRLSGVWRLHRMCSNHQSSLDCDLTRILPLQWSRLGGKFSGLAGLVVEIKHGKTSEAIEFASEVEKGPRPLSVVCGFAEMDTSPVLPPGRTRSGTGTGRGTGRVFSALFCRLADSSGKRCRGSPRLAFSGLVFLVQGSWLRGRLRLCGGAGNGCKSAAVAVSRVERGWRTVIARMVECPGMLIQRGLE